MNEELTTPGLGSTLNAGDNNVKLIRIVAEWWRSARYLQENKSRFEPNELEAFEYILNTPARGEADEDRFGLAVTLIREISYQTNDQFGAEASNFAGKSSRILKDIQEFADTLESQKLKSTTEVNINRIRPNQSRELGGNESRSCGGAADISGRRVINGNTWEGSFGPDGKPYGTGTIYYADGSVYTGQWSEAGPHGNGRIEKTDGDIWEALFRNGKPVDGKIFYSNGNRYEGGLNENGRNGIGKTYTDAYEEHGRYVDDSRSGNGKITFNNGDFYEGGWNDKGPHGRGTLFDSVNQRTDTGDFINGKRYGNGRMVWATTSVCYEGTWRDTPGGLEGEGFTYILPNGQRTPVHYVNGRRVNLGRTVAQPPFNPNIRKDPSKPQFKEPSGYGARNFFGIGGGLIGGLAAACSFIDGEFGITLMYVMLVALSQLLFVGKFSPSTGITSRRTFGSPVALTGIIFALIGFGDTCIQVSATGIFAMIIGIIAVILAVRK